MAHTPKYSLTMFTALPTPSSARIAFPIELDAAALPDYFAQANAAIYPFDDTLINRAKCSVKLIHLLSAGVPVVADAVGQNAEYIRHNETGVLVRSGDVEAMVQAVVDLLRDREKADRLGRQAAQDVNERFNWDRLVLDVERIYRI